jgi:RNA polymerase sigma-70 factor (ECF subfamily)
MVLGVCRRILHNAQDAEDAFQATFLVLVRRGASIRPAGQVGPWLYGVAYRTAMEARRASAKRRRKEACLMPRLEPVEDAWGDLRALLDRELSGLPAKYRAPVVLCDLEGLTRQEAAGQLGWPEGTVSSRLSRARALLARRLTHKGVALSAGGMSLALSEATAASVPSSLQFCTVQAATQMAAGQGIAAEILAARTAALTERVLKIMWVTNLKLATILLIGLSVTGLAAYHAFAGEQKKTELPRKLPVTRAVAEQLLEPRAIRGEQAEDDKEVISVTSMPPVVVKTVPAAGDTKVDADKVTEVRVTFSKDMMDGSWSWSQISDETFPKVTGKIHYAKDKRTCILPVKLEAGKTYVFWLNSAKFGNFKDAEGRSAIPYLLVFETKP